MTVEIRPDRNTPLYAVRVGRFTPAVYWTGTKWWCITLSIFSTESIPPAAEELFPGGPRTLGEILDEREAEKRRRKGERQAARQKRTNDPHAGMVYPCGDSYCVVLGLRETRVERQWVLEGEYELSTGEKKRTGLAFELEQEAHDAQAKLLAFYAKRETFVLHHNLRVERRPVSGWVATQAVAFAGNRWDERNNDPLPAAASMFGGLRLGAILDETALANARAQAALAAGVIPAAAFGRTDLCTVLLRENLDGASGWNAFCGLGSYLSPAGGKVATREEAEAIGLEWLRARRAAQRAAWEAKLAKYGNVARFAPAPPMRIYVAEKGVCSWDAALGEGKVVDA